MVISRRSAWTRVPRSVFGFSEIIFSYVRRMPFRISLCTAIISCEWTNPRESMKICPAMVRARISSSSVNMRTHPSASCSRSPSVYPATTPIEFLSRKNVSNVNFRLWRVISIPRKERISPDSIVSLPILYPSFVRVNCSVVSDSAPERGRCEKAIRVHADWRISAQ